VQSLEWHTKLTQAHSHYYGIGKVHSTLHKTFICHVLIQVQLFI